MGDMKRGMLISLFLVVAGAMTAHSAVISGVVSDSAGTPLKKIYVALKATSVAGTTLSRDTTDSTGAYSVTCDSTTGKFVLKATDLNIPPVYITQYDSLTADGTAKTINLKMAKTVKVTVSGIVSDSVSGAALPGIVVRLGAKTDTTAADGVYSFDSVTSGPITISVTAAGYTPITKSVTVGSVALTADIKLVAPKYSSISGIITDSATGTPISGVVVQQKTRRDTTGADGKYVLDSVTTGAATVGVTAAKGYTFKTTAVTVTDTALTVDFKLVAIVYGSVGGTVTDSAAGTAIPGAIVTLSSVTTFVTKTDTAGTDGSFSFDSLQIGKYSITASASKYALKADSVALSDTARKTLDFKIVGLLYFAVSGKVTDSVTGAAVVGALVALRTGSTTTVAATIDSVLTDSSGHYSFTGAFVGGRIRVTATGYTLKRVDLAGTTTAAQTIDMPIVKTLTPVKPANRITITAREAVSYVNGSLVLNNFNEAGAIRLVNMKGELVHAQSFPAGVMVSIQLAKALSAGTYVVQINRKSGLDLKRIVVK
jgi:hypothetical protein